jgi:hypothetical protein
MQKPCCCNGLRQMRTMMCTTCEIKIVADCEAENSTVKPERSNSPTTRGTHQATAKQMIEHSYRYGILLRGTSTV